MSFGLQGLVGVVALALVGLAGVGGTAGAAARLGWWRVLAGGVVTRDRWLRHASAQGYGSWSHAQARRAPVAIQRIRQ